MAEDLPKAAADAEAAIAPPHSTGWRCLRFDNFEFDEHRGELRRRDGRCVELRPRAEALLRLFLANPGRLIGRDELMTALWPDTVVTDDSLVQCVGELRTALEDHGHETVRTVRGRGYRWEPAVITAIDEPHRHVVAEGEPVAAARLPSVSPQQAAHTPAPRKRPMRIWGAGIAALFFLLGAGALAYRMASTPTPVHIDEEMAMLGTVAVMPFGAPTAGTEDRALADLVADTITSQFATRRGMRGIGRAATAAYAQAPLSAVAEQLKASMVVIGHLSRIDADTASCEVQLVVARSGAVVWAGRIDVTGSTAAAQAGELGQRVVNAVRSQSTVAPADRPWMAGISEGTKQSVLGWRDLDRYQTQADLQRARSRFEDALRYDAEAITALNGLAVSFQIEQRDFPGAFTPEQAARYEKRIEQTRELAPDDATALLVWASLKIHAGRPELAIPALERSIAMVPSYANAYLLLAQAKLLTGHDEAVQALVDKVVERGSGDTRRVSRAYLLAAEAALALGKDEQASALAKRSIAEWPANTNAHAVLAAIEALMGHGDAAAVEIAELRVRRPGLTVATFASQSRSRDPGFVARRARLHAGLERAGLPLR